MNVKCRWCHVCATEDKEIIIPHHLERLLPEEHCHCVCSYTPLEHGFTASVKLKLYTREEAVKWLEDFQRSSNVTLRVGKTYPRTEENVRRNSYRVDMRCQHNTRRTGRTKKNTNCPAGLYLVLKKHRCSQNRKSRSTDGHIQEGLLLHVTIKHQHNHHLVCAEAFQQRRVSKKKAFCETATGTHEPAAEGCAAETPAPPTGAGGSSTGQASTEKEHLEGRLRSMFEGLVDKLRKDETFRAPVESLVSSYESMCTDGGLMSALSAFGKGRSTAPRHMETQPRKDVQMNTQTGVEPTAAAHPKTPLEGRGALTTGPPPKRATKEQDYGMVKEETDTLPRRPAPHSPDP